MSLKTTFIGFGILIAAAPAATADDAARRLDPVSISALRPIEPEEATAAVTLLSEDDLAIRLAPNPVDALRSVPGLGVSRSGSLSGLTQVRLRGGEANHTLVLFDGIEMSDPVTGETDFGLLTALPVARIEVLRGSASSLYGSDAIGGVIAIRSDTGAAGFNAFAEAGSFETVRGTASLRNQGVGLALSGLTTEGVDTSGSDGETDGSDILSGLATASIGVTEGWALNLTGLARQTDTAFDSDTDFDGRLNDSDNETEANQWLIGALLSGATGRIDHQFRASFNEVSRDNFSGGSLSDTATGERTQVSWSPGIAGGGHSLTGLAAFERETYDRSDVSFGGLTDIKADFESFAFAAEYRFRAGPFDLGLSARHDDNRGRFDDATTWRAGAGYAIEALSGRLRLSAGTGVKNPTFTELFGFFPGSFIGNPALTPEKSLGWDIGWEQTLGTFRYDVTYFEADLRDEIFTAFLPGFLSTARNRTGESERSGLEASARWQVSEAFTVSGQVTSLESENETGADEIRVPDMTASLAFSWRVRPDGLRIGAALDHTGEQGDLDFGAFPARRVTLDPYTLLAITAEYPLNDRVALTLRGENLLDETATDVFGYRGTGAGVFAGLRIR